MMVNFFFNELDDISIFKRMTYSFIAPFLVHVFSFWRITEQR